MFDFDSAMQDGCGTDQSSQHHSRCLQSDCVWTLTMFGHSCILENVGQGLNPLKKDSSVTNLTNTFKGLLAFLIKGQILSCLPNPSK